MPPTILPGPATWEWDTPGASATLAQIFSGLGALRHATTGGALIGDPITVTSDVWLNFVSYPFVETPDAELTTVRDVKFTDVLNDTGEASFTLQNDDTQPEMGDLVRVTSSGEAVLLMICESFERITIDQGEEAAQATNWSGRGHLALYEKAVVYPSGGVERLPIEDDRTFGWASPSFDSSAWGNATVISTILDAKVSWGSPGISGIAPEFPDDSAGLIWDASGTRYLAPDGTCYFRREFNVATTGPYVIYWIADNEGELYLDGQKILSREAQGGFTRMSTVNVQMSAGDHLFAATVTNYVQASANPGGLAIALYLSDSDGTPLVLLVHTDSAWSILPYPLLLPGMTPGKVIRVLLEEVQARGLLTDLLLGFTDDADTAGNPWPVVGDIATKVGTDMLTFLKEMTATYVDLWMPPATLTLYAWNTGGRGATRTVDYHPPTDPLDPDSGNLTGLRHLGSY